MSQGLRTFLNAKSNEPSRPKRSQFFLRIHHEEEEALALRPCAVQIVQLMTYNDRRLKEEARKKPRQIILPTAKIIVLIKSDV